jgi:hypothetical protein
MAKDKLEFHNGSVVRFAGVDEGRGIIGSADAWVQAFSPFDRQLRMASVEPVSQKAFLDFAAAEVREWDPPEIETMATVITAVRDKLAALEFKLDLPDEIVLVQTSGAEEGNAGGYTRGKTIIVPERQMQQAAAELEAFILHELFHVMTRHEPAIRLPLYAIIGFKSCNDIEYPQALLPRKITNPDAFHFDAYIEVTVDDRPVLAMPVTLSKSPKFTGGSLFENLAIEMLEVSFDDAGIVAPRLRDGSPILHGLGTIAGFWEQIGRNTMYIVHAEEILADNFAQTVMGSTSSPNPEIHEKIARVLARKK